MALSKLAAKCRQCPFVDKCDNKRMEAHGLLEMPNIATPFVESGASAMSQPIIRETITIMVDGKPVTKYRDEIEKELYKQLYSGLGLCYGV